MLLPPVALVLRQVSSALKVLLAALAHQLAGAHSVRNRLSLASANSPAEVVSSVNLSLNSRTTRSHLNRTTHPLARTLHNLRRPLAVDSANSRRPVNRPLAPTSLLSERLQPTMLLAPLKIHPAALDPADSPLAVSS